MMNELRHPWCRENVLAEPILILPLIIYFVMLSSNRGWTTRTRADVHTKEPRRNGIDHASTAHTNTERSRCVGAEFTGIAQPFGSAAAGDSGECAAI